MPDLNLIVFLLLSFSMTSIISTPEKKFNTQQEINNPLPECPESPNCKRVTLRFDADSSFLYETAYLVLQEMNAHSIQSDSATNQINSVFRIPVFGWLDDMDIAIQTNSQESVVFIRSASREGWYDLGVNKRRVRTFTKKLTSKLSS